MKAIQNKQEYKPKLAYLHPILHSDIYDDVKSIVNFYTSPSRLSEIFHDRTQDNGTQYNEAVNNSSMTLVPKARNYATSSSFSDRVYTMIGIHNMSHLRFYAMVFSALNSKIPNNLLEYLWQRQEKKTSKRIYQNKVDVKKKRTTGYASKYVQRTCVEEGFYESNCGLDLDETIDYAKATEMLDKRDKEKNMSTIKCRSNCGLHGHYDKKSYLCPLNKVNVYNQRVADGEIIPTPREPPKGKKQRKAENVFKQLGEINEECKNDSASNQHICLPCVEDTDIQNEGLNENSMIIFDDGEEELIEVYNGNGNEESETTVTPNPQPAVTTKYAAAKISVIREFPQPRWMAK